MSNLNKAIAGITIDYFKGPIKPRSYNDSNTNTISGISSDSFYFSKLLSEDELEEKYKYLDKDMLVMYQILSEDFILRHLNDLKLEMILRYQVVSEDFMRDHCFSSSLDPEYRKTLIRILLEHQVLSSDFIRSILIHVEVNKLFHVLCQYQYIDEELIRYLLEHYDNRGFYFIIMCFLTRYQNITSDIIEDFPVLLENKECKNNLCTYQALGYEWYLENKLPIKNAQELSPDDWRDHILISGHFDSFSDYFVGYKVIRADGYSDFNYRYKFDKDNTYTTLSDYSYDNISFGFGIFDQYTAEHVLKKYYRNAAKFKVAKVKIYYKDVTYVSTDGPSTKVRAKEITIL